MHVILILVMSFVKILTHILLSFLLWLVVHVFKMGDQIAIKEPIVIEAMKAIVKIPSIFKF